MSPPRPRRSAFWRRRAATRRGLLAALGAIVLVTTAALSVIVGVAAREPTAAARAGFAAASSADGSMVYERSAASDASTQDAAVRLRLRHALRGVEVDIAATAVGDPVPVAGGSGAVLPLRDDGALRARTTGLGPLGRGQASIDEAGARALSLSVGETLTLSTDAGSRTLLIVSIWRPEDAREPAWNGIGPGAQGTRARLVLAPDELRGDGVVLMARWAVSPTRSLTASQLTALASGFRRLAAQASSSTSLVRLEGGGAQTVAEMRAGIAAAAAVVPVPVAVLSAAGLLALILLVNLMTELRRGESVLLLARGASASEVALADLRAGLAPVAVGAVLGASVAQTALLLVVGPPTGVLEWALPVLLPVAAALTAVLVSSLLAVGLERSPGRGGSRRAAVAAGAVLLVLAGVGVARLLSGGAGADIAAELAPALLIAALAVAGLLLGEPLNALADRVARSQEGVAPLLTFRRLRHRPGMVVGAVVLVALAVAVSGFAASTTASSAAFLRDAGRVTTGGDLAVSVARDPAIAPWPTSPDPAALAAAARATAGLPALVETVQLSDLDATLAAAPVHRLASVQSPGLAQLDALAGTAPPSRAGIALPAEAGAEAGEAAQPDRLRVRLSVQADAAPADTLLDVTAWLSAADSELVRLDLGTVPVTVGASPGHAAQAVLPGGGPWRLVALDAGVQSTGEVDGLSVRVQSLYRQEVAGSRAIPLPSSAWKLASAIPHADGVTATGAIGWAVDRLLHDGGHAELGRQLAPGSAIVPVVLSRALAASTGLGVGDRAVLDGTPSISVRVTGIVAHTIGTPSPVGVWADLATVQLAMLRTAAEVPAADRVWLAADDPASAAERAATAEPGAEVDPSPVAVLSRFSIPATVALIAGAAGSLLFALVGIGAATEGLLRSRRDEILVLRALGAGQSLQQASLRGELVAALVYAVVVGAIAAAVTAIVTVPALAHAADPGAGPALQAGLRVEPFGLLAAALVLAIAGAVAFAVLSGAVRRAAATGAVETREAVR